MIKKHKKLIAYLLALTIFSTYVVMDTFVITRVYGEASGEGTEAALQIESGDESAGLLDDSSTAVEGLDTGDQPDESQV